MICTRSPSFYQANPKHRHHDARRVCRHCVGFFVKYVRSARQAASPGSEQETHVDVVANFCVKVSPESVRNNNNKDSKD
jgi:hypothetical protein